MPTLSDLLAIRPNAGAAGGLSLADLASQPFIASQREQAPWYDPMDYSARFNTGLTPAEEAEFELWAKANNRQGDAYDYDIRGAWRELQSGRMTQADNGHLGDKYKKPNHPTFSDQSIYHGVRGVGGAWGQTPDGRTSYTPAATALWAQPELERYFAAVEPGVVLNPRVVR